MTGPSDLTGKTVSTGNVSNSIEGFGIPRRTLAFLLAGSCAGVALVLFGTGRFGAAVTPDSAMYVAASKSLIAGNGYQGYDGNPFVQWPPLYPTLLALGAALGTDVMQAGRIINAIAYGLIVLYSGWLLHTRLRDVRLAWFGFAFVLLGWPLLQIAMKIWSDLVFVLLTLLSIGYAPVLMRRPTWPRVSIFAALVALSTMQRYAGLALVAVGVAMSLVYLKQVSVRHRVQYAIGFCLIATGPLVLWLWRNYQVTSTLTGSRSLSEPISTMDGLSNFAATITTWIVPPFIPPWVGYLLGGLLLAAVSPVFFMRTRQTDTLARTQAGMMLLFVAAYTALVVGSSAINAAASPNSRLLAPLYVPFVFLVMFGLERGIERGMWLNARPVNLRRIAVGVFAVWMLYPAASVAAYVYVRASYDTNAWTQSEMAQWLKHNQPDGRLYSNQPWVVYLSTGADTQRLPTLDVDAYLSSEVEEHNQPCMILWFYGANRGQNHAAGFLSDFFQSLPDGPAGINARALSGSLLDFMRRGGVTARTRTSGTEPGDQAANYAPLSTSAKVVRTFEDGSLYVFTTEAPTDR